MVFLRDFHWIPMGFLCNFYNVSMGFLWHSYGMFEGILWDSYGISLWLLCYSMLYHRGANSLCEVVQEF